MGLYIKGMEMPTHCIDCPFMVSRDNDDCILQSDEANENFENWEQMKAGCPLVPVPPHGRLVDTWYIRDEIIQKWMDKAGDSHMYKRGMEDAYEVIRNAPTIIPAEEKSKEEDEAK